MTDSDSQPGAEAAFVNWLAQIYSRLPLDECVAAITNETRLWSGWDRVSLLIRKGQGFKVASVSGAVAVDPRSNTVKLLQEIATRASTSAISFSTTSNPIGGFSPYHERCEVNEVVVIPLRDTTTKDEDRVIGFLVCDQFTDSTDRSRRSVKDLEFAGHHIANAIANSLEFESARSSRLLGMVKSKSAIKFGFVAGVPIAVLLALCLVTVDLTVSGTGVLNPQRRQDVFAAVDGFVEEVFVSSGQSVSADDPLLTLRNPEVELTISATQGELQTISQQLVDLEKLKGGRTVENPAFEIETRMEELKSQKASLTRQLELLLIKQKNFKLHSSIDGEVMTPEIEQRLAKDRPVRRTDRLLQIADLEGLWTLEVSIPQEDINPVVESAKSGTIQVDFVTANQPDVSRSATDLSIAESVTVDSPHGVVLRARANVDREVIPEVKPGTNVRFRVTCGRAPVGYVWFRRLIDRVQSWWTLNWA